MSQASLAGHRILITRAPEQATELANAVEAAGGIAMTFPLLDILPRDEQLVSAEEQRLPSPDMLIYVSANAVIHGIRWHRPDATTVAIGPATLSRLQDHGIRDALNPGGGFESESLLADPVMVKVAGKRIRIIRGQDGRELMRDTLSKRGAAVDYLAVYERRARRVPDDETGWLRKQLAKGEISCITIMSVAGMQSLLAIFQGSERDLLHSSRLVTPSRRVLKNLHELMPDARATLAPGPQADDMILGLSACLKQDDIE